MGSSVASSDKSSVCFVMEIPGKQDSSEATSRRTDLGSPAPRSGLRRSLRQAAVVARHILDEENIEVEGGGERDVPEGDDKLVVGFREPEGEGSSPGEEEEQRAPRPLADWGSCNLKDSDVDKLVSDFHPPTLRYLYSASFKASFFSSKQLSELLCSPAEIRAPIPHSLLLL
ncbi:UNVERIFIED_CONTAM: hypothetical protein Slati_1484200 [Sesamum latifolium]|uniref:Uncharacterized protein n=1 Tax=Sesamum latifolium TaxID=2727402 RepID=A0AAW2X5U8_9LAMI